MAKLKLIAERQEYLDNQLPKDTLYRAVTQSLC